MKLFEKEKLQPIVIAFISLCLFVFIILQYTEFYNDKKEKDERSNLLELLVSKKAKIEKALNSRIYYTKGVAAYTSINPEITVEDFYRLANELIQNDTVISTMSISKDCIIGAIYPLEGHESAIGLNLLEHPFRRLIVENTIRTRNTFIAGPVELVEGGKAFISYTPIFIQYEKDSSRFWGVTDIVIWKDKFFNELKFFPRDDKYEYALKGIDGTGINGKCIFGDENVFNKNPEMIDILLPTGNWTLASVPLAGWESYLNKTEIITIILYISAFIISLLIWLLTKAMIKIRGHELELRALFGSMQDLIIVFNKNGEYVKIAPTNESLLVKPAKELQGKTLFEVFGKKEADYFMDAILECLRTKELVVLDYPLEINSEKLWFQARISYLTEDTVIYVANDNTKKMKIEEDLRNSEQKLKELNATKDKLFSIIAHDLRGPFGATLGLTEILMEDLDKCSHEEIATLVKQIKSALEGQFGLLENLLNWSQMQTGRMELVKSEIVLKKVVQEAIDVLSSNANSKSIELQNTVNEQIVVKADENMLRSVFHNLISNAIKFTNPSGSIAVSAESYDGFYEITVSDTGIGMSEDVSKKIFMIDSQFTSLGTNGEKGTGLGLTLVKEMIEKHNGKVSVKSEKGKGSEFSFTLPLE